MTGRYCSSSLEGVSSLREVVFTDAHRQLLRDLEPGPRSMLAAALDHTTALFDTATGDLLVITQPYTDISQSDRNMLLAHGLALLRLPDYLAPYRTSPGAPVTHPYLICKANRARHFTQLIRSLD